MQVLKKSLAALLLLSSVLASAQGTRLLRQPTLSADHIVFVYANDLWIVERDGEKARRLTSNEGAETNPHLSPDGKTVAFSAQYGGNTDVYTVPVEGGEPRRLTWHGGSDAVQGWTPDGAVLFRSNREAAPTLLNRLYTIDMQGGLPQALDVRRAAYGELSADGRYLAYIPITFWDAEWRNYRGGQAQPIWIADLKNLSYQRTPRPTGERHLDPVWFKEKVYFISERDYTANVWSFDPKREELQQLTTHTQFDVKSLNAGPDALIYEQGGYLHLLDPASGSSQQLRIEVRGDQNWARPRWEDVSAKQLRNGSLSPTGQRALFEYRGEIFTVPREQGSYRNLSNSPGVADRDPVWSPAGDQVAWFSDANGEYQLMITDQMGMEKPRSIPLPNPTFYFKPTWSPDGKHIAFTDTDYNLWYVNLETTAATRVDTDGFAHPNRTMNPVWSPDSKWITYVKIQNNQFKQVMLYSLETGESQPVSSRMVDAITPVFDESGDYLYYLGSTDYGLSSGWLDMSSYDPDVSRRLYIVLLSDETPSPLLPRSDEESSDEQENDSDSKPDSTDLMDVDLDNIQQRTVSPGQVPTLNFTGLGKGPQGSVFILENVPNASGLRMHKYNLEERKLSTFLDGISTAAVSQDRKNLLYSMGGSYGIVSTSGESQKPGNGKLSINIRNKVLPREEYEQILREGWRFQRDFLYVDNVHGAPWDKIYEWYQPWVKHVRHRSDMNYIIDILGGEVSVGHSYTSGGDFPDIDRVNVGLLGADLQEDQGYYRIERIYAGDVLYGADAPLGAPGLDVQQGDYILSVNGQELRSPTNPYQLFENTAGEQVLLEVSSDPQSGASRTITVVPIRSEYQLRTIEWINGNRRKVNELSDGQLAYVYVPNTGGGGFASFNRYYFAQQDKKGAIIDERNNGGGSAADYMVDVMARELHGYFNSKAGDRRPFTTPIAGIYGPKVMLINERAGSGGDLLPYLFRRMEIGPLVGTRTWGGLVGTWDTPPFIDGGRMVAPRGGFYDVEGEWAVEGEGVAPDIEVIQDPKALANGEDPQLERAVKEAMQLLKTQEVKLQPEPPAPDRWRRAEGND